MADQWKPKTQWDSKVKEKGLLFYEQPSRIFDRNPVSTQSRGRTGTALQPLVFETNASTDSAIWALPKQLLLVQNRVANVSKLSLIRNKYFCL